MDISRQTAVRAGLHFPFYAFQETIFGEGQKYGHTDECEQLQRYYAGTVPAEMRTIFINPSFTLQDLAAAYRKYPGKATQEEELWLNDQLNKALYGLPQFIYRWFRLGQASVGVFTAATSGRPTFKQDLGVLIGLAATCGLRDPEKAKLAAFFQGLNLHFASQREANPFEFTGNVFSLLSELATHEDSRNSNLPKGSPEMKLLTLVVLMLVGLSGFYILDTNKAVMWLLFVVIAIPPILAVMFESEELSGSNIVELYKAGLKGLPFIGRMIGKSE